MRRWKKFLIGGGAIIIGLGLIFLIYWFFFKPVFRPTNKNVNVPPVNITLPNINKNLNGNVNAVVNVNAGLPEIADGGETLAQPLVAEPVKDSLIAENGTDVIYYDRAKGQFYKISSDARIKTLMSNEVFPQVDQIYWSPSRDKAIMEFPDNSKIMYDFKKKKQYTLPKEMEDFSFSPSSDQISFKFIGADPTDRWLAISNADGSGVKIIEPLGDKANFVAPNWSPNGQVIATYAKSVGADKQEIVLLGQYGENFKSIEVDGSGFEGKFSPDSAQLLYSVYSKTTDYNPELYIVDAQGDHIGRHKIDLGVETWPSKCAISMVSDYVYCAVPRYLDTGSGLYPELADTVPDDFYRIDINTGSKELLAVPVDELGFSNFNAQKVYLSENEQFLYFQDRATGQVLRIRLR